MARPLLLAVPLVLMVLAGCGGDAGSEPDAPAPPEAPREVANRAPLPFGGHEEVMLNGSGTDEDAAFEPEPPTASRCGPPKPL